MEHFETKTGKKSDKEQRFKQTLNMLKEKKAQQIRLALYQKKQKELKMDQFPFLIQQNDIEEQIKFTGRYKLNAQEKRLSVEKAKKNPTSSMDRIEIEMVQDCSSSSEHDSPERKLVLNVNQKELIL